MDFELMAGIIEQDSDRKANVWEGYGKKRLYVSSKNQKGRFLKSGYIELNKDGILEWFDDGPASRLGYSSLKDLDDAGIHVIR